MIIKSNIRDYSLQICSDYSFFKTLLGEENTIFVIDEKVYNLYLERLFAQIPKEQVYLIEAVESKKNIDTVLEICEKMTEIPAKRNAHLISLGGGIIQDITGFVANVLYRGIRWTFIPTTLLAACDSCIGGKTSLNYKHYKNLLGTFYPPEAIFVCSDFFRTLPEADFRSGLGEVVKFNMMFGDDGLRCMEEDIDLLLERNESKIDEYVEKSLSFKKDFIEEDEFDKGVRINLNFAHTFGHAFETMSNYVIPHGTAVAMGMVVANRISLSRGWLLESVVRRMEQVLFRIIEVSKYSLTIDMDKMINAICKDKKQTSANLTAVLMYDDMKLKVVNDLKREEAEVAIKYIFEYL